MSSSLVSITLLMYEEEPMMLKRAIESVAAQTYRPIEFLILNNGTFDRHKSEVVESLNQLNDRSFTVCYEQADHNLGFAAGHNHLIERSKGEFITLLNSDAVLTKEFLEKAIPRFSEDHRLGAIQPKIYRYDFTRNCVFSMHGYPVIDVTGLKVLRNRRVIARGQGQPDRGQFDREEEVFGADGAAPIFRREALEDVALTGFISSRVAFRNGHQPAKEYFDTDFFSYKEDSDLAWRLRLANWKTLYCPYIVAYHARRSGDTAAIYYRSILKERKQIPVHAREFAWCNQRLMQLKNELPSVFIRHLFSILSKEIASLTYLLFFERSTLRSIVDFVHLMPNAWRKRRVIMKRRRATAKEMCHWF